MLLRTSLLGMLAICIMAGPNAPAAGAAPDDACALLTPAQVSVALGVTVAPGMHPNPQNPKACVWSQANGPQMGGKSLFVSVLTADEFNSGKAILEQTKAAMKARKMKTPRR